MRIHAKKDSNIDMDLLEGSLENIDMIFRKQADIGVTWEYEDREYEHYEWEDYGGYLAMKRRWINAEAKGTRSALGLKFDILLFAVEDENWKPTKIWGVNLTNDLAGFHTTQARVDNESHINTQGTIYHEILHTLDQTVYNMLGVRVEDYLEGVHDFDDCVVHGECGDFEYVRFKENAEVLSQIADDLRKAYALREQIYTLEQGKMFDKVEALLRSLPIAYRTKRTSKARKDIPTPPKVAKKMGKIIDNETSN